MPAKKPDKKAPVQTDEDLSDISSLPHLPFLTMTTLYHFYIKKNLAQVKEELRVGLSEESIGEDLKHVKTITRDSILELAQGMHILLKFS
jgi:hypothetical protein